MAQTPQAYRPVRGNCHLAPGQLFELPRFDIERAVTTKRSHINRDYASRKICSRIHRPADKAKVAGALALALV